MAKPKYRKGERLLTIGDVADAIMSGSCLYFNDKPQNSAWLQNMSLRTINCYVASGHVWRAVEKLEKANG